MNNVVTYKYRMNIDGKDVVLVRAKTGPQFHNQYNELLNDVPVRAHNFNITLNDSLIGRTFKTSGCTYKLLDIVTCVTPYNGHNLNI